MTAFPVNKADPVSERPFICCMSKSECSGSSGSSLVMINSMTLVKRPRFRRLRAFCLAVSLVVLSALAVRIIRESRALGHTSRFQSDAAAALKYAAKVVGDADSGTDSVNKLYSPQKRAQSRLLVPFLLDAGYPVPRPSLYLSLTKDIFAANAAEALNSSSEHESLPISSNFCGAHHSGDLLTKSPLMLYKVCMTDNVRGKSIENRAEYVQKMSHYVSNEITYLIILKLF